MATAECLQEGSGLQFMDCHAPGFRRSAAGRKIIGRGLVDAGTVGVCLNRLSLQFLLHSQNQPLPEQFKQVAELRSGQPAAEPGGTLHGEGSPVVFEEPVHDPTAHEFQLLFRGRFRGHGVKELPSVEDSFEQSSLFAAESCGGSGEDSLGGRRGFLSALFGQCAEAFCDSGQQPAIASIEQYHQPLSAKFFGRPHSRLGLIVPFFLLLIDQLTVVAELCEPAEPGEFFQPAGQVDGHEDARRSGQSQEQRSIVVREDLPAGLPEEDAEGTEDGEGSQRASAPADESVSSQQQRLAAGIKVMAGGSQFTVTLSQVLPLIQPLFGCCLQPFREASATLIQQTHCHSGIATHFAPAPPHMQVVRMLMCEDQLRSFQCIAVSGLGQQSVPAPTAANFAAGRCHTVAEPAFVEKLLPGPEPFDGIKLFGDPFEQAEVHCRGRRVFVTGVRLQPVLQQALNFLCGAASCMLEPCLQDFGLQLHCARRKWNRCGCPLPQRPVSGTMQLPDR